MAGLMGFPVYHWSGTSHGLISQEKRPITSFWAWSSGSSSSSSGAASPSSEASASSGAFACATWAASAASTAPTASASACSATALIPKPARPTTAHRAATYALDASSEHALDLRFMWITSRLPLVLYQTRLHSRRVRRTFDAPIATRRARRDPRFACRLVR